MPDENMTPEQIAELQKKNCVFCRIIAGEIESKKVFENDSFLAILDIRPAAQGHVLLMPKDHVPILPLLPEEKMIEAFRLSAQIGDAVKEAMIAQRATIFIASGYAAGQQAPHLIIHIIPREKGDGLEMLDLERKEAGQADTLALASLFGQASTQALMHRKRDDLLAPKEPAPKLVPQPKVETTLPVDTPAGPQLVRARGETGTKQDVPLTPEGPAPVTAPGTGELPPTPTMEFESTSEALEAALNMSPDLRKLIIAQPDLVADYVARSPKLAKLFEGVNIHALSLALQRQEATRNPQPERTAAQMTEPELFRFIDSNEGLRTWMLDNPDELATRITENPRLQRFFINVDIKDTAKRYKEYRERAI
jgi:histidine triad (HIT) family protein